MFLEGVDRLCLNSLLNQFKKHNLEYRGFSSRVMLVDFVFYFYCKPFYVHSCEKIRRLNYILIFHTFMLFGNILVQLVIQMTAYVMLWDVGRNRTYFSQSMHVACKTLTPKHLVNCEIFMHIIFIQALRLSFFLFILFSWPDFLTNGMLYQGHTCTENKNSVSWSSLISVSLTLRTLMFPHQVL